MAIVGNHWQQLPTIAKIVAIFFSNKILAFIKKDVAISNYRFLTITKILPKILIIPPLKIPAGQDI